MKTKHITIIIIISILIMVVLMIATCLVLQPSYRFKGTWQYLEEEELPSPFSGESYHFEFIPMPGGSGEKTGELYVSDVGNILLETFTYDIDYRTTTISIIDDEMETFYFTYEFGTGDNSLALTTDSISFTLNKPVPI